VRGRPSTVNGASRFLRKWPTATLDRGASAPPPVRNKGQAGACPDRTRAIPCKVQQYPQRIDAVPAACPIGQ